MQKVMFEWPARATSIEGRECLTQRTPHTKSNCFVSLSPDCLELRFWKLCCEWEVGIGQAFRDCPGTSLIHSVSRADGEGC